jgi:hypothetical protein
VLRDDKELEICIAGLEFESGRVFIVRAWNSRGFTRSPKPTKYAFWKMGLISSNSKKNSVLIGVSLYAN